MTHRDLVGDLERLARVLARLDLGTAPVPGKDWHSDRENLIRTIRSYLVPRLTQPDAPLCVVFAGPTGAGKSTLVNSLAGRQVSGTGPLRPTTRCPVVLTHPAWRAHFASIGGVECETVIRDTGILHNLALVDTPDIDSTITEHRVASETLLDHADVVVFVTSALRYADRVPWEVLRRAMSRGAALVHVINRVSAGSAGAVTGYRARLLDAGVDGEIVRLPEHHLGPGSFSLASLAVAELSRRLTSIATEREVVQEEVLERVLDATLSQASELAAAVEARRRYLAGLADQIRRALNFDLDEADTTSLLGDQTLSPFPTEGGRRSRRWVRRRLPDEELATTLATIRRRLLAVIEADLRLSTLAPARLVAETAGADGDRLLAGIGEPIGAAIDEWFGFVGLLAQRADTRSRNLATLTLISHALGGDRGPAVAALFREPEDELSGRARRDLAGRIDQVYGGVVERLVLTLHSVAGETDASDLHDALVAIPRRSLLDA